LRSTAKHDDTDGHEIEEKPAPPIGVEVDHDVPLKMASMPAPFRATQNAVGVHETVEAVGADSAASATGELQVEPLNENALSPSNATHDEADAHDTDASGVNPSMSAGPLHDPPLKVNAFPAPSTAAQNAVGTHETTSPNERLRSPLPRTWSIRVGAPHEPLV
jgi:hypothetical protein